jgi:LmbE family N-acetylglucosaminyl deacetylase
LTSDLREQFPYRSLLAVCAHPDDEAFGLGAVISTLRDAGVATSLLCFTHGEASTLGASTDEGGITGHPDHQQATTAARTVAQRRRLPLLAWTLTRTVTDALNEEFRAGFVGRNLSEIDVTLDVDRTMQHDAIACHASQSADNPVLRRRLSLQGNTEVLVWLDRPDTRPGHPPGRDHSDGT